MHQPVCLSVHLCHTHTWVPAGEEEWQTHSEHTVTPYTSVVSHLGTLKAWP